MPAPARVPPGEERQAPGEDEEGGQEVFPSRHVGHGGGLDRVGGKDEGSRHRQGPAAGDGPEEPVGQDRIQGVQEQVEEVVSRGVQAARPVVQRVGEGADRPVDPVAQDVSPAQLGHRPVLLDQGEVVVDEPVAQGVPVEPQDDGQEEAWVDQIRPPETRAQARGRSPASPSCRHGQTSPASFAPSDRAISRIRPATRSQPSFRLNSRM